MTKMQALLQSPGTPKWVEGAACAALEAVKTDPTTTMNAAELLSQAVREAALAMLWEQHDPEDPRP